MTKDFKIKGLPYKDKTLHYHNPCFFGYLLHISASFPLTNCKYTVMFSFWRPTSISFVKVSKFLFSFSLETILTELNQNLGQTLPFVMVTFLPFIKATFSVRCMTFWNFHNKSHTMKTLVILNSNILILNDHHFSHLLVYMETINQIVTFLTILLCFIF